MLLAFALLLVVATDSSYAAGTPAGTTITSTATVTFLAGLDQRTASSSVSVYVAQEVVINFVSPSNGLTVDGTTIYRQFTITNTGNYIDNFSLATQTVPPGWSVTIYNDANNNSVLDPAELSAGAVSQTGPLAVSGAYYVILAITIPHDVANNSNAIDGQMYSPVVRVTSVADDIPASNIVVANKHHYQDYTANVTIKKPVIVFTATQSTVTTNASRIPGAPVTYSFSLQNTGSLGTATTSTVTFILDPNLTYVSSTASGLPSGVVGGKGGTVTWTFTTAQLPATPNSPITFSVVVTPQQVDNGTGIAPGTQIYAMTTANSTETKVQYNDGANTYNQDNANSFNFVVGTASGASWSVTPSNGSGTPGNNVDYTFTLMNTGNHSDNYTFSNTLYGSGLNVQYYLSVNPPSSFSSVSQLTVPLGPGATQQLYVRVTIPSTVGAGAVDGATIGRNIIMTTQTSSPDAPLPSGSTFATFPLTTTVNAPSLSVAIAIESISGIGTITSPAPGDVLTFKITISNTGSADATTVTVSNPIDASMTYVPGTITIDGTTKTDTNTGVGEPDGAYFDGTGTTVNTNGMTVAHGDTHVVRYQATVK